MSTGVRHCQATSWKKAQQDIEYDSNRTATPHDEEAGRALATPKQRSIGRMWDTVVFDISHNTLISSGWTRFIQVIVPGIS
jgi:hypothetical protein